MLFKAKLQLYSQLIALDKLLLTPSTPAKKKGSSLHKVPVNIESGEDQSVYYNIVMFKFISK